MADGIAARFDTVNYTAFQERALDSVLMLAGAGTSGRGRAGIRPGQQPVTVGGTPESAIIAPFQGIVDAVPGTYRVALPAQVTKPLAARPASGQARIDVVTVEIIDTTSPAVHEMNIDLITGTSTAGTPTAPTIPAGQLRLAELVVPASGAVSVQNTAQRTVAAGGILPVANQAERDAIAAPYDGLTVYREDTDRYECRLSGAWGTVMVDQGWTAMTLTGTTGWTIDRARFRVTWPRVEADIWATRTGATLTGDSGGNIPDTNIATGGITAPLPADDIDLRGYRSGVNVVGFRLTSAGAFLVCYTAPGGAIASGTQIKCRDSYVLG